MTRCYGRPYVWPRARRRPHSGCYVRHPGWPKTSPEPSPLGEAILASMFLPLRIADAVAGALCRREPAP